MAAAWTKCWSPPCRVPPPNLFKDKRRIDGGSCFCVAPLAGGWPRRNGGSFSTAGGCSGDRDSLKRRQRGRRGGGRRSCAQRDGADLDRHRRGHVRLVLRGAHQTNQRARSEEHTSELQ